jgi:hypothetical protein
VVGHEDHDSHVTGALLALACGGGAAAERGAVPTPSVNAQPSAVTTPTGSATPSPATSTTSPTASPPALAVVPMRFVASPEGQSLVGASNFGFKTLELNADGTLVQDGAAWGLMRPDAVAAGGGMIVFYIGADGVLTQHEKDHDEYAKLLPDGIRGKDGLTLTVADDGTVSVKGPTSETVTLHGKFDAIPPNGKRAAALLMMATRVGLELWTKTKIP